MTEIEKQKLELERENRMARLEQKQEDMDKKLDKIDSKLDGQNEIIASLAKTVDLKLEKFFDKADDRYAEKTEVEECKKGVEKWDARFWTLASGVILSLVAAIIGFFIDKK